MRYNYTTNNVNTKEFQMYANEIATLRNFYTADTCKLVTGRDWARWELHWEDGGMVCCTEDSRAEAVAALRRYGFNAA